MKRNDLKYLINLHERINIGCKLLGVKQEAFIPALTQLLTVVSLGMEMGLRMKKEGAAKVAGSTKKAAKAGAKKGPPKTTMPARLVAIMGRKMMDINGILAVLATQKDAPESKNMRGYVNQTLISAKDKAGKPVFTQAARGFYFVTSKQSKKEIAKKLKNAQVKAAKERAAAKATSKTNGHAKKAATALLEAAPVVH
jgi:hypothetical protein